MPGTANPTEIQGWRDHNPNRDHLTTAILLNGRGVKRPSKCLHVLS